MKSLKRATPAGFTIVETLIVLSIAGLILLIVFEALPALQRNSRNSERRQDVSLILDSISHYELNDSGNFPLECGTATNACSDGVNGNDNFLRFSFSKLAYYGDPTSSGTSVILHNPNSGCGLTNSAPCNQPAMTNVNEVDIWNYEKCNSDGSGSAVTTGAGYNDIVALFAVENGSGATPQCQQL